MRRLAIVVWLVVAVCASADLVDPERLEAWELWREQPLDLREATPEELALLPGADPQVARAIVTLRDVHGELSWDALQSIEGVDAHTVQTWSDYATLTPRIALRTDVSVENGAPRVAVRAARGGWSVGIVGRNRPNLVRGWIGGRGGRWDVTAGALRVDFGAGLALGDVLARSRSGAVGGPRTARVRGRTDGGDVPGWEGAALRFDSMAGTAHAIVARDADGRSAWVMGLDRVGRGATDHGFVVVGREDAARGGVWVRRRLDDRVEVWAEGARTTNAPTGATLFGARARGSTWTLGGAWTRSSATTVDGRDPVTGAALDRAHRAWQVDGTLRQAAVRLDVHWRHRVRGGSADERLRADLLWRRPRVRDDDARWSARAGLGLDDDLDAGTADPWLRGEVERSTPAWRVRLTWARRGPARDAAEAVAFRARRRFLGAASSGVEVGVATAARARAAAWYVVRPLAGVRPLWIPARGHAAWMAVETRWRVLRLGAWGWWRGPVEEGATGWGIAVRFGRTPVVRRLQ